METEGIIKVISLDPGGTTGWAKGLIQEGKMGVTSGQNKWMHYDLYEHLRLVNPDIIVCERFDFRKKASQQGAELISRELIGVVNLYVQRRQPPIIRKTVVRLFMQTPSEALGGYYGKDEALKKENLHTPGKPHANDATRHLLQWYMFGAGYQYNKDGFYPLEGNATN